MAEESALYVPDVKPEIIEKKDLVQCGQIFFIKKC